MSDDGWLLVAYDDYSGNPSGSAINFAGAYRIAKEGNETRVAYVVMGTDQTESLLVKEPIESFTRRLRETPAFRSLERR